MDQKRFAIAPTGGLFKVLTTILLVLPLALLLGGFVGVFGGMPQLAVSLGSTAGFMMLVYGLVWIYYRPTYFELTEDGLLIKWPVRQRIYGYTSLSEVEVVSYETFKARHGQGMRVGAGGLWGGFGLLVCKNATFNFYISALEGIVLMKAEPRPLMITPERADEFAKALQAKLK